MQITRRHLPHYYEIGEPLFVTFRLHGTLPTGRVFPLPSDSGKAFVFMDRVLDAESTGPTYLRMPAVAAVVADAIVKGASRDYLLHAWVVMPNHVHLLITPQVNVPGLLHRLKGVPARECNKLLGQTGRPFWQGESYDRLVRSPNEFRQIESYIALNPVRAGLVRSPEEYRWSSVGGLKPTAG